MVVIFQEYACLCGLFYQSASYNPDVQDASEFWSHKSLQLFIPKMAKAHAPITEL